MTDPTSCFRFGAFTLDPTERLLSKEGRAVSLTPKAFDLLTLLVRNAGRLLTKNELIEQVWPDTFVEESNLAYNVFTVRKALGDGADGDGFIETVPKRGYRFVAPVSTVTVARIVGPLPLVAVTDPPEPAPPDVTSPATSAPTVSSPVGRDNAPARWSRPAAAWSIALSSLLLLFALGALWVLRSRETVVTEALVRFQIPVPVQLVESNAFSVSPDGRLLAFVGTGADGIVRLWIHSLDAIEARPVSGTESRVSIAPPFWSPDSKFIAYDAGEGRLDKVSVSGGAPQPVCHVPVLSVGGSWNREGVILVGNAGGGLLKCNAEGGEASPVTTSEASGGEIHLFPSFLPDGVHFLYARISRVAPEQSGVYVGALDALPSEQSTTRLISTGFNASYLEGDSGDGRVMFVRDGTLFAQPFDVHRLMLMGDPVAMAAPVGSYLDFAFFSASANGVLVSKGPDPDVQLTWFDRSGRMLSEVGEPGRYLSVALSPDGTRAVAVKHVPQSTVAQDLWLFELSPDGKSRRLTFDARLELSAVWARQGDRVLYGAGGGLSGVYERTVDGDDPARLLFSTPRGSAGLVNSVSPDAREVLFSSMVSGADNDLWIQPLSSDAGPARPFLQREFNQGQGQFSPDGHWVAYVSNESGPQDVFVTRVLESGTGDERAGESYPISKNGGTAPRWSSNGRELLYLSTDGHVMSVDVTTSGGFHAGTPRPLFRTRGALPDWGISPDGRRLLLAVPVSPPAPFDVVLRRKVLAPPMSKASPSGQTGTPSAL